MSMSRMTKPRNGHSEMTTQVCTMNISHQYVYTMYTIHYTYISKIPFLRTNVFKYKFCIKRYKLWSVMIFTSSHSAVTMQWPHHPTYTRAYELWRQNATNQHLSSRLNMRRRKPILCISSNWQTCNIPTFNTKYLFIHSCLALWIKLYARSVLPWKMANLNLF